MFVQFLQLILLLLFSLIHSEHETSSSSSSATEKDRLTHFYQRLQEKDVKYCSDPTKLLPLCQDCIPGLQKSKGSFSCNEFISSSQSIRDEIRKLVVERFGTNIPKERYFGLYPYLEKPDFLFRHVTFAKLLSKEPIQHLIDIGAYYNPIHLFLPPEVCPQTVIIIEPILDAVSAMVPCQSTAAATTIRYTHFIILPITFKYYIEIKSKLPMPETVVCIGCDSHYGPNRKMLETTFQRPYKLFLEYPSDYVHNAPFRKMMGEGPGETLLSLEKFQAKTNETIYTKRVMKVIEFK